MLDLHLRAFDTATNHILLLGETFMARGFRWYLSDRGAFALVAEHESSILGYLTANEGSYYSVFSKNWRHVFLAFLSNPTLLTNAHVRKRLATLIRNGRRKTSPKDGRHACLAYLTVEPDNPVRGVAPALVRAALTECRRREWRHVTTSFHVTNKPAQVLYAMLGFKNCSVQNTSHLVSVCYDTWNLADANTLSH